MRATTALVASIAILGASPAPADAQWLKKIARNLHKEIQIRKKPPDCWGLMGRRGAESAGKEIGRASGSRELRAQLGEKVGKEVILEEFEQAGGKLDDHRPAGHDGGPSSVEDTSVAVGAPPGEERRAFTGWHAICLVCK